MKFVTRISVCLSVCLCAHISQKPHVQTSCMLPVSVPPLKHCDFEDDVTFSNNVLYGAHCVFISITAKTAASILTKFCSMIKISQYTLWVAHWWKSLLCMITL